MSPYGPIPQERHRVAWEAVQAVVLAVAVVLQARIRCDKRHLRRSSRLLAARAEDCYFLNFT